MPDTVMRSPGPDEARGLCSVIRPGPGARRRTGGEAGAEHCLSADSITVMDREDGDGALETLRTRYLCGLQFFGLLDRGIEAVLMGIQNKDIRTNRNCLHYPKDLKID